MTRKGKKRNVTWVPNPNGNPEFGSKYAFKPKFGRKMSKSINLHLLDEDYARIKDRVSKDGRSIQDFVRDAIAFALGTPDAESGEAVKLPTRKRNPKTSAREDTST